MERPRTELPFANLMTLRFTIFIFLCALLGCKNDRDQPLRRYSDVMTTEFDPSKCNTPNCKDSMNAFRIYQAHLLGDTVFGLPDGFPAAEGACACLGLGVNQWRQGNLEKASEWLWKGTKGRGNGCRKWNWLLLFDLDFEKKVPFHYSYLDSALALDSCFVEVIAANLTDEFLSWDEKFHLLERDCFKQCDESEYVATKVYAYLDIEKLTEAKAILDLIPEGEYSAGTWVLWANYYYENLDWEKSKSAAKKAMALDENEWSAASFLGFYYEEDDSIQLAKKYYSIAMEKSANPSQGTNYFLFLRRIDRRMESIEVMDKLLEKFPKDMDLRLLQIMVVLPESKAVPLFEEMLNESGLEVISRMIWIHGSWGIPIPSGISGAQHKWFNKYKQESKKDSLKILNP